MKDQRSAFSAEMETARIDLEGLVERCPQGPKGIRVTGTAFLFVCFVLCF